MLVVVNIALLESTFFTTKEKRKLNWLKQCTRTLLRYHLKYMVDDT